MTIRLFLKINIFAYSMNIILMISESPVSKLGVHIYKVGYGTMESICFTLDLKKLGILQKILCYLQKY